MSRNPSLTPERTCRVCGCTDLDCSACLQRTGHPCHWVETDLCSACDGEVRRLLRPRQRGRMLKVPVITPAALPAPIKPRLTDIIGIPGAVSLGSSGAGLFLTRPCGCPHGITWARLVPGTAPTPTLQRPQTCQKCGWRGELRQGTWHTLPQKSPAAPATPECIYTGKATSAGQSSCAATCLTHGDDCPPLNPNKSPTNASR